MRRPRSTTVGLICAYSILCNSREGTLPTEAFSLSPKSTSRSLGPCRLHADLADPIGKDAEFILGFVDDLLKDEIERGTIPTEEEILERVTRQHALDYEAALASPLAIEEVQSTSDSNVLPYEWILEGKVAAQSLAPVLNVMEIATIRLAAETLWETQGDEDTTSRFTYQFKGNSEAHAADFDSDAINVVNRLLTDKLYPWIRAAFPETGDATQLYVYDSLFIRYNASASESSLAGQPLHRDLGVVSVNIMLNDDFEGGGTYFDNQLPRDKRRQGDDIATIKPSGGPGHCIAHCSNERHAGAGTVSGVRDILVFFISAKEPIPTLLNARLKQTREVCDFSEGDLDSVERERASILCRIRHQRIAAMTLPDDGEAYLYLGSALMDYAQLLQRKSSSDIRNDVLRNSMSCFDIASKLTPNDARIWNNWGIASARYEEQSSNDDSKKTLPSVASIYQAGLDLLLDASRSGCAVDNDLDSIALNYGLYLANQNLFTDAAKILEHTAIKIEKGNDHASDPSKSVQDAHRLWTWCQQQIG